MVNHQTSCCPKDGTNQSGSEEQNATIVVEDGKTVTRWTNDMILPVYGRHQTPRRMSCLHRAL